MAMLVVTVVLTLESSWTMLVAMFVVTVTMFTFEAPWTVAYRNDIRKCLTIF